MSSHPAYLWLNGSIVPWESATVHVVDARSLLTVSSVYEGIRGYWNPEQEQLYVFRLSDHMRRFGDSMKVMRMQPAFDTEALTGAVVELLKRNAPRGDVYIRPVGSFAPDAGSVTGEVDPTQLEILIYANERPSSLSQDRRINVAVSSWTRISDNSMPPRVKSNANYLSSRLVAAQATADGYDGAIILNANGTVAEGPWACVFMVRDGVVITPSVTSNILESITRRTIIQLVQEALGACIEQREVGRTELYIADELFFCGTGAEVTPIVSVDRYKVGSGAVGPITGRIRSLYFDIVRGKEAGYRDWLTPVY
ncbi:MAG: branched-chain amino acid transaminase [Anaerolineae bacterium]